MTMTTEQEARAFRAELIVAVRYLARTRVHRLSARQLDALESQTTISIQRMRTYLQGRPVDEAAAAQVKGEWDRQVAEELDAADQAAQAAAAQQARSGRRPGPRITEEGIYYYDKHVYKVIKSQYSGHFQARRLNPNAKRDKWTYIQGMMGILRAEDKMTAADSREYEALYGYPTCTDCGAPLENDQSRARRVGPVCWVKNGHTDSEIGED